MTQMQKLIKYLAIALGLFLIVSIASGILAVLSAISGIGYLADEVLSDDRSGVAFQESFSDQAKILDIEIGAADVSIVTGAELRVETDNPYISVKENTGTLIIREESHIAILEGSKLTLYIPEDMVFTKASITTGAGRIQAEQLSCRKLDLELGAGMAEFQTLSATDSADIDGGAGQILIHDGSLNNLDFDMGVGEGNIVTALTGQADITAGVGALYLTVLGAEEDYTVRAEQGLGRVEVENSTISGQSSIGSGPNVLDIEGGIGNITVDFEG